MSFVAICHYESLFRLGQIWLQQETYSHGWFVAILTGVFLVRAASRKEFFSTKGVWSGLLILLLGEVVWFVARAASVQSVEFAALPVILLGAIGSAFGLQALIRSAWPVGLLYWAIPIWDAATGTAQNVTIWVVSKLLGMTNITAFVEGSTVFVRAGQFEIARGCSGIHYIVVASALGAIYGYLFLRDNRLRAVCIGVGVLAAAVLNWLRVFIIVVAGDKTDMQHYLVSVDHYWFGWILFALMVYPLLLLFRLIEQEDGERRPGRSQQSSEQGYSVTAAGWVTAVLVVVLVPVSFSHTQERARGLPVPEIELPAQVAGWSLVGPASNWSEAFPGASSEVAAIYESHHVRVNVYRNLYVFQEEGAELISEGNLMLPIQHKLVSRERRALPIAGTATSEYVEEIHKNGNKFELLQYVYIVDGKLLADPRIVKLRQLHMFLVGRPAGGIVAARKTCRTNCELERDSVTNLLAAIAGEVVHD